MKKAYLDKNHVLAVIYILTGVMGVIVAAVTLYLWHKFGMKLTTAIALAYSGLMLLTAFYAWRNRHHLSEKASVLGYWFASSSLIFSTLLNLVTAPAIASLPLYHPKTLSCLVMGLAGGLFAVKAFKRKSATLNTSM